MAHKIELIPSGISGARSTMFRCGTKFEIGKAQVLDLTSEQLEAFKSDVRFKVSDSKDSGEPLESGTSSKSETILPTSTSKGKAKSFKKVEVDENQNASSEEIVEDEVEEVASVETLLKNNSRDELNELAAACGIEDAESFENKTEVAQAIVAAL